MYRDRIDAARRLLAEFGDLELRRPLVLAIPRGGVVIGDVLARGVGGELDVVLTRKLRAPYQPELAIGAVAEDGGVYIDASTRRLSAVTDEYLERERQFQQSEIERRRALYRTVRAAAPIAGRTVIVTDDGIATGATMKAALKVIQAQDPHEIIVAAPVSAPEHLEEIRLLCDRVICPCSPSLFWSIGQFYEQFEQVPDERVVEILQRYPGHPRPNQPSERAGGPAPQPS